MPKSKSPREPTAAVRERVDHGRTQRDLVPIESYIELDLGTDRPDPVELLVAQDEHRLQAPRSPSALERSGSSRASPSTSKPTYLVRQDVYRYAPRDTVLGQLDEVMASAYSVSLLADFASPTVMQAWLKTRFDSGQHPKVAPTLFGATWYDDSEEYGVRAPEALRTLGARISPHLLIAEIRTAAADSLWRSPAYERDVLCVGFTWAKHPVEVAALLPVIDEALAPFALRPHWGKLFHLRADVIGQRFPRPHDFMAVPKRYDPEQKFWDPLLESALGTP